LEKKEAKGDERNLISRELLVPRFFHSRKLFVQVNEMITADRTMRRNSDRSQQRVVTKRRDNICNYNDSLAIRCISLGNVTDLADITLLHYFIIVQVSRERDVPKSRRARLPSENCRTYENDDVKAETECCHESLASVLGNGLSLGKYNEWPKRWQNLLATCSHS